MVEQRVARTATVITVVVMWFIITRAEGWIASLDGPASLATAALSALASVGVYRSTALALRAMFSKWRVVRRLALGPDYLEGTWVGWYYIDRIGAYRFTVEHVTQTTELLSIEGTEFDADGALRSTWLSDGAAVVDQSRRLVYGYRCTVVDRGTHQGLAEFHLVRAKPNKAAVRLDGWAADIPDGKRDANREQKISDRLVPKDEGLQRAVELLAEASSGPAEEP